MPDQPDSPALALSNHAYRWLLGLALALGCVVRASFVLSSSFPLNDGGMFFQMVRDLQHAHYALPVATTYNGENLPFGYPPLGFYLAALIDDLTPMSLVDVFRFMPLALNIGTLFAFMLLARRLLTSRLAVLIAVFTFGMLPPAFMWMIMGGGVTRTTGFFFALLALRQMLLVYERPSATRLAGAVVLCSAVMLSHLEMAWFTAFSAGLLYMGYGRRRGAFKDAVVVAVGTAILTSPWWATVIAHNGIGAFIAAGRSGTMTLLAPVVLLVSFDPTLEKLFPLMAAMGLVGVVVSMNQRQFVLPAWVVLAAFLDARAFPTGASVPLAMLVAVGVESGITAIVRNPAVPSLREATAMRVRQFPAPIIIAVVLSICAAYAFLSASVTSPKLLSGLSLDERAAMAWAAANTPDEGRFVIVTSDSWAVDRTSEWFPALTGRNSVATVQGWEWVSGEFRRRQVSYKSLQDCADQDGDCLLTWRQTESTTFDYVYIPRIEPRVPATEYDICCAALRRALSRDSRFEAVYDGPGASIYRVRDAGGG